MEKKLYRDEYHKKIAGVCAGLAEYFNVDVAVVRVIFVLALIFHGGGLLIYVIFWIVLPKRPYIFSDPTVDYRVPPQTPGQGGNPYQGNPYGGNPYQGNPFSNQSFGNNPFPNQPFKNQPRSTSVAGIVVGVVLIIIGGSILLDDFDIIPDWNFGQLWPIVLVAVGAGLIFSGEQKKPWEKADWQKAETATPVEDAAEATPAAEEKPADNPPTV